MKFLLQVILSAIFILSLSILIMYLVVIPDCMEVPLDIKEKVWCRE